MFPCAPVSTFTFSKAIGLPRFGCFTLIWAKASFLSTSASVLSILMFSNNNSSKSELVSSTICTLLCFSLSCFFRPSNCGWSGGLVCRPCACLFLLHTCSQWLYCLHFRHLVQYAGHFFPWLSPHYPHCGLESCLTASIFASSVPAVPAFLSF